MITIEFPNDVARITEAGYYYHHHTDNHLLERLLNFLNRLILMLY
jgi:hypothetical protein